MDKRVILERVRAEFLALLEQTVAASNEARDEATDDESRGESKYDTHAVEASYLAAGQAERAEEMGRTLQTFNLTQFPDFAPDAAIEVGALVDVDFAGERVYYLICTAGGGTSFEIDGRELTVLAPTAPLASKLMGAKAGDKFDQPALTIVAVM